MVSLDAIAAHLAGFSPQQVYTLAEARRMGFTVDPEEIACIGDPLDDLRISDLVPASQMSVEGPGFFTTDFLAAEPLRDNTAAG